MGVMRKPATVSPQRQALADAIAAREAERARIAAVNAAVAGSEESMGNLQQRVVDLRFRLDEMKLSAVNEAVRAAAEGRKVEAPSMRDVMVDLADAEAALDVANETRARLRKEAEKILPASIDKRVQAAALAVLQVEARGHAEALAAEIVRMHRAAFLQVRAVQWLVGRHVLPVIQEPGFSFGRAADNGLRSALMVLGNVTLSADGIRRDTDPDGATEWKAALAALEHDATAPLPTGAV